MQGIYKIINLLDNKYYVGSSLDINFRWGTHRGTLRKGDHKNDKLQNAWNKHLESSFTFTIVEELPLLTEDELRKVEDKYLAIAEKEPDKCYNCCYDSRGGKLSAYTIEKIRTSCKKVVKSPAWLAKMAEGNRRRYANGYKYSDEAKAKMAFRGKHSAESKKKVSDALLGTHRPTKHSDMTIRTFYNVDTEEQVTMPTYEFGIKYNTTKVRDLHKLISGETKCWRRWRLL